MRTKTTQEVLVLLALVPLLLLPVLVGTCSGDRPAPRSQDQLSDVLTAGH